MNIYTRVYFSWDNTITSLESQDSKIMPLAPTPPKNEGNFLIKDDGIIEKNSMISASLPLRCFQFYASVQSNEHFSLHRLHGIM